MVSLLDKKIEVLNNTKLAEMGRNLILEEIVEKAGPEHAEKALDFWEEQLINVGGSSQYYSMEHIVYATNRLREYKEKLYVMLKVYR